MYLVNSEAYLGKQTPESDKGLGEQVSKFLSKFIVLFVQFQVVNRLGKPFMNSGHKFVTDNFFTNNLLGQALLKKKTHLIGTLRKNRIGNLKSFISEKVEVCKPKKFFKVFVLGW